MLWTAQKLMQIVRHSLLINPAHVRLLPPSWGTLYELTKLEHGSLMQIANHPIISNRNHGNDLPPSWFTLYELTKLD